MKIYGSTVTTPFKLEKIAVGGSSMIYYKNETQIDQVGSIAIKYTEENVKSSPRTWGWFPFRETVGTDAIIFPQHFRRRAETHNCRSGTDQQRINKDRQHLDQPLFHRVGNIGGGRRIGRRTDPGLVGIQPPLHPQHDHRAGKSPRDSVKVKRTA